MSMYALMGPSPQGLPGALLGKPEPIEQALWLRPQTYQFTANDMQAIVTAFAPLKGIIWHASSGKGLSDRIRHRKRAFGDWSHLISEPVLLSTTDSLPGQTVTYSDVAWLSEQASQQLSGFFQRSTAGQDSAFAFVPHSIQAALEWASIVQALNWLWLCRRWIASSPQPSLDAYAVVRSYLSMTHAIGGVAALMWMDSDATIGLTLFGPEAGLAKAMAHLDEAGAAVPATEVFDRVFRRGIHFRLCP